VRRVGNGGLQAAVLGKISLSLVCILNDAAGPLSSKTTSDKIADLFARHGVPATVWVAHSGAELAILAKRAVAEKYDIVVAAGGDGTVNCVSAALVGTTQALGIPPLGTLNHFAKDLEIPLSLEDAIDVIAKGQEKLVDVGEVNGQIFLNNSSLGLYPRLVRKRERLQNAGSGKWTAFLRAIGYVVSRYSHLHVRLDTEAAKSSRTTPFIFIGNNKYQTQGWNLGKRLRLDAGNLWLYTAPHLGPVRLILLALRTLFSGREMDQVDAYETKECWIETKTRRLDVARDGEVSTMNSPFRYRIRPRALRVMGPSGEPTGSTAMREG
jgi:diacylglycerol kinase family enzyme